MGDSPSRNDSWNPGILQPLGYQAQDARACLRCLLPGPADDRVRGGCSMIWKARTLYGYYAFSLNHILFIPGQYFCPKR